MQKGSVPPRARAVSWQILLGCLPKETALRRQEHRKATIAYFELVTEHFNHTDEKAAAVPGGRERLANNVGEDEDLAIYFQVYTDVIRTFPFGFSHLFNNPTLRLMLLRTVFIWAKTHPEIGYYQGYLYYFGTPNISQVERNSHCINCSIYLFGNCWRYGFCKFTSRCCARNRI